MSHWNIRDLGLGAGKLEGAYAKLPRYFADADRVMDLEQRLPWCLDKPQALDTKDVIARRFSAPGRASDMRDLVAFIANMPIEHGMKIEPQLSHPKEKEMAAVGEEMFYRRGGVRGFCLRYLSRRRGQEAHPLCSNCRTSPSRARRPRKRWAPRPDLSRVARRAAHHAAPAMGLLPAAALARA
ncbi:MAG: hypothetical protein MZV49_22720 [Rhodopseudomonas palustris]|nr:hypothetical protein [Rhodopseudomonas palustris]